MTEHITTTLDTSNPEHEEEDFSLVGSECSFVNVGSCDLEFLIKIAIQENGTLKHHRVRLKDLVNSRGEVSFSKLKTHVKKIAVESGCCKKKLELCYKDEDGDLCLVTSTSEFLDAIHQFVSKGGSLKLEASSKKTRELQQQQQQQQQQPQQQTETCPDATTTTTTWKSIEGKDKHVLSDPVASSRIVRAMRGSYYVPAADIITKPDCPEAMALSHLLNDFQDHINLDHMPAISILTSGGSGPNAKAAAAAAAAACHNNNQEGPLVGHYTLKDGTQWKSQFLAMDDIYLDLTEQMPREDVVQIKIPKELLERLSARISPGGRSKARVPITGGAVHCRAIEAKFLDPCNPPLFVTLKEEQMNEDSNGKDVSTGVFTAKSEGTLTEIIKSSEHRHVYKISAVFKIENKYVAEEGKVTLAFSLVALRVFSVVPGSVL